MLRWLPALRPLLPTTSLGACTGIHTGEDVARAIAAGGDVAMVAAALIEHGPARAAGIVGEPEEALARRGHGSLADLRAAVASACGDARSGYLDALQARMARFRAEGDPGS